VVLLDIIPQCSVFNSIKEYSHKIMGELEMKASQNSLLGIINFNVLCKSLNSYAGSIVNQDMNPDAK
jgi:hypothetical protein